MQTIIGIITVILYIIGVMDCLKSSKSTGQKVVWIIIILVLPILGYVIYHFIGKK